VHLCAVRTECSRRVIGWAVADHLRTELVTPAAKMAVAFRGTPPPKVIFHAELGSQIYLHRDGRVLSAAEPGVFGRPDRCVLGTTRIRSPTAPA
jgi:transposase InsO family protein